MESCKNPYCPVEHCNASYKSDECKHLRGLASVDYDPDFEIAEVESEEKYLAQGDLLSAMWKAFFKLEDDDEKKNGLNIQRRLDFQTGFECGQQVVSLFPAANVQKVRRGRWYLDGSCPFCREKPLQSSKNFCCNCGADLRND